MKVVIGGGGTAGHVFPALAVARTLAERHGADVRFVGTARGLEAALVPAAGFEFTAVEARPFVRKLSLAALRAPIAVLRSVRRCREIVRDVASHEEAVLITDSVLSVTIFRPERQG